MKIIEPSVEHIDLECCRTEAKDIYRKIERIGRVCYKSEDKITDDSAEKFIKMIISNGHESVLEHHSLTFKIICDRGISHELVRHRIASYSQESTRYVNYESDDIQFIKPSKIKEFDLTSCGGTERNKEYLCWKNACFDAESKYYDLRDLGVKPENARSVLPNCLKTEIVMTANIREWRHFLQLRTSPAAHPDMQVIAYMILDWFKQNLPVFVGDFI